MNGWQRGALLGFSAWLLLWIVARASTVAVLLGGGASAGYLAMAVLACWTLLGLWWCCLRVSPSPRQTGVVAAIVALPAVTYYFATLGYLAMNPDCVLLCGRATNPFGSLLGVLSASPPARQPPGGCPTGRCVKPPPPCKAT